MKLSERLAALSEEQRRLLRLKARRRGVELPPPAREPPPPKASAPAHEKEGGLAVPPAAPSGDGQAPAVPAFSLFFFSADGTRGGRTRYDLLLESARFADRRGFEAIWTPERHFQAFGGLYPNPSVLSAALAVLTERLRIRAGSLVLPLHNPVRVAEDWALLDNLSGGRVGISLATGWHPRDFALSPGSHRERREITHQGVDLLRRLWAGEALRLPGGDGREVEVSLLPRPLQPELPLWLTTSGSRATWLKAGELGTHVLSGLQGPPEDALTDNVRGYREARRQAGHDPSAGRVTVMLHTFLGDDLEAVREAVRAPMTRYLRTFVVQSRDLELGALGLSSDKVTDRDLDDLAGFLFAEYFEERSLLGTPAKCAATVERLARAGVDEVACLVDFGLPEGEVLAGLERLAAFREAVAAEHRRRTEAPA